MRTRLFLAIGAILAPWTQTAAVKVWVFGDSDVDTGWYKISPFSGDTTFDSYLANTTYNIGKPTNNPGPMSVEILATLFKTTAQPYASGQHPGGMQHSNNQLDWGTR